MTETYSIIKDIILGGKTTGSLKEEKAENVLTSLLLFCRNREFYESEEVVRILKIVDNKILREAISLKKQNIDKMLEDIRSLDFLFLENNPTLGYGTVQLEIIAKLQTLRYKRS